MGFSENFLWGAATAAYQIEGAVSEDGRVPGTWDAMTQGHVRHNETGTYACDHYHRMKEDVAAMKKMGLKCYRFSVAWPRVISDVEGTVNQKGLDFYRSLVDELEEAGIEPLVTLFHWDLPMWAYEHGGWLNDDIADWFAHYAEVVVDALSDKVRYWLTINEPVCFGPVSWQVAVHPPFMRLSGEPLKKVMKNILLSHGRAVEVIRERAALPPLVGLATTCSPVLPASKEEEEPAYNKTFTDESAEGLPHAGEYHWADAIFFGDVDEKTFGKVTEEERALISQPLDFFGVNIYSGDRFTPLDPEKDRGYPRNACGWPIEPEALYWGPKFLYRRYNLPIFITENGFAGIDFLMSDGKVHDPQRVDFLKKYLHELKRAADEVPVLGYCHWSLMDNMEWCDGYDTRFGLWFVNYPTCERIWKDSAYFYADVIKTNGEEL